MNVLAWIVGSTLLVSLISLIGVLALAIRENLLEKILLSLVALSAGALIGGAFLHLIPEALEKSVQHIFLYVLAGFVFFFLAEKILYWRHCHKAKCEVHSFAYMNLLGDLIHNFVDGLIIAASYVASVPLGIATTLAVALHEIPQEIGDFGVLVYGGFKKTRALLLNFATALTAIIGGLLGYFLSAYIGASLVFLLPFAGGGFVYIAAADLIPEIKNEANPKKAFTSLAVFLIGIGIMFAVKLL